VTFVPSEGPGDRCGEANDWVTRQCGTETSPDMHNFLGIVAASRWISLAAGAREGVPHESAPCK
jgi:hypothetical protein